MLVFLETNCPACRLAVPYLKRLAEALGSGWDRIVAVPQNGEAETRALIDAHDGTFPVLFDDDLVVSRAYDPPSVPALFLIGKSGRVERSSMGFEKGS